MNKLIVKAVFFAMYFLAAGVLSYFIPHPIKFVAGFIFAWLSAWAWKMISTDQVERLALDPEQREALREFICTVYIMRDAQRCYETVPEGKYLIKKLEFEGRVDADLKELVSSEAHQEWKAGKSKEVHHG
jgi:hypothetical protein